MSPAAVILAMPVATVALRPPPSPPDPRGAAGGRRHSPGSVVVPSTPHAVPSLPLHHARSCFRVYQPGGGPPRAAEPRSPGAGGPVSPPPSRSASDEEVSALLRHAACVDLVDNCLLQLHHNYHQTHRLRCPPCCDSGIEARGRCDLDLERHHSEEDTDLVETADDVTVRQARASVMNATALYRPSLDFYKMQVRYTIY